MPRDYSSADVGLFFDVTVFLFEVVAMAAASPGVVK